MEAGYYLLIDGDSVMIRRVSDRFVYLEAGVQLTREQAGQFKCSSERTSSVYLKSRQVGQTYKAKQIGLL